MDRHEARKEAIAQAQAHLVRVLASDDREEINIGGRYNDRLHDVLSNLRDARDEFERWSCDIRQSLDDSAPFVRGQVGRWNSSGILQSSALRLEMAVAKFSALSDVAKGMLVDHYLAAAEQS